MCQRNKKLKYKKTKESGCSKEKENYREKSLKKLAWKCFNEKKQTVNNKFRDTMKIRIFKGRRMEQIGKWEFETYFVDGAIKIRVELQINFNRYVSHI